MIIYGIYQISNKFYNYNGIIRLVNQTYSNGKKKKIKSLEIISK